MDGLDQRGVPEQAQVQRNDKQSETRKQKEKTKLEKEKERTDPNKLRTGREWELRIEVRNNQ